MPEAASVAQLADTSWKLERLSRVENGRMRARLEEELEKTDEFKTFALTRRALEMVGALAMTVEAIPTLPKDFDRTSAFLTGVEHVMRELREVPGLPMAVVEPLALALDAAQENGETEQLDADSYKHLGDMAKVVKGALSMKLAEEEAAFGPVRERLAAEVLLLEDEDLRKLERTRRTLESTMQRQLAIFHQRRAGQHEDGEHARGAGVESEAAGGEVKARLRVELEFFGDHLASCTPSRSLAYALAFLMGGPMVSRASPRAREVRAPLTPKKLEDHREK
jgi:hypothetical protein